MRFNLYLLAVALVVLVSCNGQSDQNSEKSTPVSQPLSCYTFVKGNDTIMLSFIVDQNAVKGDLTYNFFEKDDNTGTIDGTMQGDTLFADYKFQSEGKTSEREVAFLRRGDTMVEGFGEIKQESGKSTFKNRKRLNFESNLILTRSDCK